MVLDKDIIVKIIGKNKRFIDPYADPEGYYIIDSTGSSDKEFDSGIIELYYEKLRYAAANADSLINEIFDDRFYGFYGVDRTRVDSPSQMCAELYFDSFVMYSEDKMIGSCLSNDRFMFGHFIDASWDMNWKVIDVWIN